MMISNATKVQANPVSRTTLRWKEVNPPSFRTSSTVRVAVATEEAHISRLFEGFEGRKCATEWRCRKGSELRLGLSLLPPGHEQVERQFRDRLHLDVLEAFLQEGDGFLEG